MTTDIGVYCIKNIDNGKSYVGSSTRINRRWVDHKSNLRHNRHGNTHLQRAWNKYGKDAFEFSILVELDTDIDTLRIIERMYLRNLEPEYNMHMYPTRNYMYGRTGDKHPNFGKAMFRQPHSEESKALMSKNHPRRKLNEVAISAIKFLCKNEGVSQKKIAAEYGVDPSLISRVVNGKKWKHTIREND